MSMGPFDYDPGWREKLEDNEDEWVDGFAVPYRLRFLLPMINFVHYSTLWTKYRIQHYGAMIPRKVFLFYPNSLREDYTAEALYFDDEEQDTYTRQLQKEDIMKNESYAKVFSFLVITPFPSYFIRLYYHRVTFLDAFSMISMLISAWSIPAVRTDSLAVVLPGQWKLFFLRLNIYITAVITLHVIFAPPGRVTWDLNGAEILWMDDVKHFGMLPLIMALMSHCARRFMEAVSMVELEHIRYSYLPHSRGGIMDVPELPQDPPGPPPELPPSPERRVLPPAPPAPTDTPAPAASASTSASAAPPAALPARPLAVPPAALPTAGEWIPPWTANQYGFDFDQWVATTFTPLERRQESRTTPLDVRTLQKIPAPPTAPPLPMNRRINSAYYLNCYRWQRNNWPDLLHQRVLLQSQELYLESQNQETTTRFLVVWARFQTEEWEDFQRRRGQSQTPEIPSPPQPPQDQSPDTNFTYYMACVRWQREHRANLQRQRTQLLAPGEPQFEPNRGRNRELLSAWVAWQRDTWVDLQQFILFFIQNRQPPPSLVPQDPPASQGPPAPSAPPGGPPASQGPPAPPAPLGDPPTPQGPPAPPAPPGGPPAPQGPPAPPAPPGGPPAPQGPPAPSMPPKDPPAPQGPPAPSMPPKDPPAPQGPPAPSMPPKDPPASQGPPAPPIPPASQDPAPLIPPRDPPRRERSSSY